jgi:CheY-like chemotaxis protein
MVGESLLVLVVEDNPRTQDVRKKQLEGRGWQVILAETKEAAIREMDNSPTLDAVLTDANLDPADPTDASGIDLARDVRNRFGDIPILAYSAHFSDRPLTAEEKLLFTRTIPKRIMRAGDLEAHLGLLKDEAREYRSKRVSDVHSAREELRSRVRLEALEPAETVRRMMPEGRAREGVEHSLKEAGFRLQLVHSASFKRSSTPLLVWTRDTPDGAEAEVYGQPGLYADGQDEQDAVSQLVELMRLFAKDFASSAKPVAADAARLRSFLDRTIQTSEGDG